MSYRGSASQLNCMNAIGWDDWIHSCAGIHRRKTSVVSIRSMSTCFSLLNTCQSMWCLLHLHTCITRTQTHMHMLREESHQRPPQRRRRRNTATEGATSRSRDILLLLLVTTTAKDLSKTPSSQLPPVVLIRHITSFRWIYTLCIKFT